jgi:ABC-type branched-subunit amino acid transport system substrate-binding protein
MKKVFGPSSTNGSSFYTSYLSSYDGWPTVYAASAYDCTHILVNALKMAVSSSIPPTGASDMNQAKTFRQTVITDILQFTSYDGVTGHYSFSGSGDPNNATVTLYQFDTTNQRWNYVSTLP